MKAYLVAILIAAIQQLKPEDLAEGIEFVVELVDPIVAKKGIVIRSAWRVLRAVLTSESVVKDVQELLGELKQHPNVAAAPIQ